MIRVKIQLFLAAFLCCCMGLQAKDGSKMSRWLLDKYNQHQAKVWHNGGPRLVKGRPVRNYILALVESTDGSVTIRQKGGVVWQDLGNGVCAAFLPMDSLGVLDRTPAILRMEANQMPRLFNDTSAVILNVDKVAAEPSPGSQLPHAFTGKGVITAIMDTGLDFTHPAFRNDDGTSRIKWFWDPVAPDANKDIVGMIYTSPEQVLAARHSMFADVDNHGTHVLGSMAGRGLDGRYVGMAPDADIIGAYIPIGHQTEDYMDRFSKYVESHLEDFSGLSDIIVSLTNAIELVQLYKVFEQADAAGQPCVVNWSFGDYARFDADNTLYEEVINWLLGPGHILVVAAGNEGYCMTYIKKEADEPMKHTIIYGNSEGENFDLNLRFGEYSADFKIGFTFMNVADTLIIDGHAVFDSLAAGKQTYVAAIEQVSAEAKLEEYPGGKTGMSLHLTLSDDYAQSVLHDGWVRTGGMILIDAPFEVEAMGYMYGPSYVLFSTNSFYNSRGCNLSTICFPSNLNRVISVGAMHHRTTFTNVLGNSATDLDVFSKEGQLVSFSSCGPTLDGLVKPDVVAPGHNVISALNSFYRVNHDDEATKARVQPLEAYESKAYGRTYGMWAMSGTSMATPITAGIIALWLQAKPDLTPEDVMGVIERTSHQPEPEFSGTEKNVYYGWGEIDAYAGLLDVLGMTTSVPSLSKHQPAGVKFRVEGYTLYIDGLDGDTPVTVYNLSGQSVQRTVCTDGIVTLPVLPSGVYAVQVGQKGSTLIRL